MLTELSIFFSAWTYYTRFPGPSGLKYSQESFSRSIRYFPLMGYFVALIGVFLFFLSSFIFPPTVSILISIAATIISTGALHEDGFADVCDGFGGGWTKEQILRIMKDSRLGTFGVIGLMLILSFKFMLLYELLQYSVLSMYNLKEKFYHIIIISVASHAVSRTAATFLLFNLPYVRSIEESKASFISNKLERKNFFIASVTGIIPLFLVYPLIGSLIPIAIICFYLRHFFRKWIGGITGDCLGATQQITEVVFYAYCVVLVKLW